MRVAVTGSIATDHLMTFPGRFAEQLIPDQLHRVSLSFLVEELQIRRGGVAANICFGMARLGLRPSLVGAVGADFADYRSWLERHGVDTSSVHVSTEQHTARFLCTTDLDRNQIASFYPGAMSEARDIELGPVAGRLGGLDLVVVSPNDPEAMVRHTGESRQRGLAFVADPSQQLARMDGVEIRQLVSGAEILFTNEYESELLSRKTGWSPAAIIDEVGTWVVTKGKDGCEIRHGSDDPISVPVAQEMRILDPTGVGDAFRAGYLSGVAWGLSPERCAQVGSMLATYVIETVGTQEYDLDMPTFAKRFCAAYGDDAVEELRPHLPA
ncbi:MAG: carbohydrate kinase family protein [Frankiaceae bacterium]